MYNQLTEAERYTLSALKRQGWTFRRIAHLMQRAPSTISREIRRNATIDVQAAAAVCAQQSAGACEWSASAVPPG